MENTGDASLLEVLSYTTKDSLITFKKVYGQSDCDTTISQYKYEIKKDEITFMVIEDACEQRSGVLNNSKWVKVQ